MSTPQNELSERAERALGEMHQEIRNKIDALAAEHRRQIEVILDNAVRELREHLSAATPTVAAIPDPPCQTC